MSKTLYVPDHIADSTKNAAAAAAYVDKNEKVLDPTLVDKKLSSLVGPFFYHSRYHT